MEHQRDITSILQSNVPARIPVMLVTIFDNYTCIDKVNYKQTLYGYNTMSVDIIMFVTVFQLML